LIPQQGIYFAFPSHSTPKGLLWWSCRYGEFEGTLVSHILLRQKTDPKEKKVINLDQDVYVYGYFWWMVYELLFMDHLSFILFLGYGLSFFLSLSLSLS
jgi:hypothetical protein